MKDLRDTSLKLDHWVANVIRAPGTLRDDAAYDALQLAFGARDRRAVLKLLECNNDNLLRAGVFIVNELAADSGDLVAGLGPALRSSDRVILYDAIESCLFCDPARHGKVLGAAMQHVTSTDHAVMYAAANFLARATHGQIAAGLPTLPHALRVPIGTLIQEHADQQTFIGLLSELESRSQVVGAAGCIRTKVDPSQVIDVNPTAGTRLFVELTKFV